MDRAPAVAGMFYPGTKQELEQAIEQLTPADAHPQKCLGCVAPHAGYIYSGRVAAEVYARIEFPKTAIILSPNHRGPLVDFSIWPNGKWETPLGEAAIDEELARAIIDSCPMVSPDIAPHRQEHSVEVQVPFIQHFAPDTRIVPITLSCSSLPMLKEFGASLARAVKSTGSDVLVIASSDMTHQEPHETAQEKDHLAIDKVLDLDEDDLFDTVVSRRITMCGVFPTVAMLSCVKRLGATSAELVLYQTSGDACGDYSSVVGYAGVVVK